jgi:hypothetical protein
MRFGDALLGTWQDIARLARETTDVVVGLKEAANLPLDKKAPLAAGILLFMLAMLTFVHRGRGRWRIAVDFSVLSSRRKYLFFSVQSCIIFLRHAARLRAN